MASFEVTLYGQFWVTPEAFVHRDATGASRKQKTG
jgi:hypothetical protein